MGSGKLAFNLTHIELTPTKFHRSIPPVVDNKADKLSYISLHPAFVLVVLALNIPLPNQSAFKLQPLILNVYIRHWPQEQRQMLFFISKCPTREIYVQIKA